ncbi:hypothetical protein V0M98_38015 (plasmid) [Pseudomonas silesiensis]|uniref:hypothetical protein n=1 Tax=Pseudomonas silesiensis TaxID=1853130 RepID=UPI0030CE4D22
MRFCKLYEHIRLTCLSEPGFTFIQDCKTGLSDLLQLVCIGFWLALFLLVGDQPIYGAIIAPCLLTALLTGLADRFLSRMARQTFTLLTGLGALVLVSRHPNELIQAIAYVEQHIGAIMMIIVAAIIVTAVQLAFARFEASLSNRMPPRTHRKAQLIGPYTRLQSLDADFVAYHEAGHAIVLGLFPHRPNDIEVVITGQVTGHTNIGWCSSVDLPTHCKPREFSELYMIFLLAGREAEFLCVGEYSVSGTSDNDKWLTAARKFLQSDSRVIFFQKPETKLEFDHNAEQLEKLKAKHVDIARSLLLENKTILETIHDGLLEKGVITGQCLANIISQVKPVAGCPTLSNRVNQALKDELEAQASRSA